MRREQSYQCRFAICGAIKTIIKSENDNSDFPDLVPCGYRGCTGLAYKVFEKKDIIFTNNEIWGEGNWIRCPICPLDSKGNQTYHHRDFHHNVTDTFFPGPYLYQTGRSHCVSPEQMQLYMKQNLRPCKDDWENIKELK